MKEVRKETLKAYKELEQRLGREEQLAVLQRKMELRALLRGGRNKPLRVVKEETKDAAPIYVWAKERKKWKSSDRIWSDFSVSKYVADVIIIHFFLYT